jgi:cytochrome c
MSSTVRQRTDTSGPREHDPLQRMQRIENTGGATGERLDRQRDGKATRLMRVNTRGLQRATFPVHRPTPFHPTHETAMNTKTLLLAALTCASNMAFADANIDRDMLLLATASGCMTCHHIQAGANGPDGTAPVGPGWSEVAAKYKGVAGAADQLTHTVLTGSNPYSSHWKDKVSGLAMPPNAVAITPADASVLVAWILTLDRSSK